MIEPHDDKNLRRVKMHTSLCGIRPYHIFFILFALHIILHTESLAGQFKVIRVYDGDSFKAVGHDIEIKVRLVGIDAPERASRGGGASQPFCEESGRFLASLILDKVVDVQGHGTDHYNRVLAVVYIRGLNVNIERLRAGLAETYKGRIPKSLNLAPFRHVEKQAQEGAHGMWRLGDNYVSPLVWRKMSRK